MSVKLLDTHGDQSSNCHIVNIEFTRWEQIENLQYDNCTFIHLVYIQYSKYDKTIASCLKSIPPSPIRSLHHLNVSLLFDNPPQSPLYLDIFATEGNQSVYKWTKNWGGKLWITPMICLYDLIKKPSKVVISTLHACLIGTA